MDLSLETLDRRVLVDETRHLLLQPVILLHQQLVHRRELPVHRLHAGGLLALLLPAPITRKATHFSSVARALG